MCFNTNCDRVSQCCYHCDVCRSQHVNCKYKIKIMNLNAAQYEIPAAASVFHQP